MSVMHVNAVCNRLRAVAVALKCAKPRTVIVTTPNVEYNVRFETLPARKFRHSDHRFEWTRGEFQAWAKGVADRFGYAVRFSAIGPEDGDVGSPTQMGVFQDPMHLGGTEWP